MFKILMSFVFTISNFSLILSGVDMHFTFIILFTSSSCVHSYLSENVFTVAIKGEALPIKGHVVSSTIDRAGSITLIGRADPFSIFTSAVNRCSIDGIRLKKSLFLLVTDIGVTKGIRYRAQLFLLYNVSIDL